MGLANYHRNHIKDFAKLARPLYDLTKKNTNFNWQDEHKQSFRHLISVLTTSPILAFPKNNSDESFTLDTDASDFAIGAELLHVQDTCGQVISYGSFILSPSQRKYYTTRK